MKKKPTEYKIEKTLSSSKSVNVYLASKNNLKQNYVMKQIGFEYLIKAEKDAILAEAKLLASFEHKFILKLEDSFQIDSTYYLILDYCDGGPLADYIAHMKKAKKHLKEELIWRLFIQIALGLAYLHRNRLIHRNVKPSNILLTKDFQVRLTGLRNAKRLSEKRFTSSFIGTPYYLAPEIWEKRPYEMKVDVWALGVVLFELCALDKPFRDVNEEALEKKIVEAKADPIPKIYSKELQGLVAFLLNRDELARPTIDEVILTHLFVSKSKSVHLYDYLIKQYPDIEEKKLFIKSIKDRENEKRVYLKKNAVELYVNDTKSNYSSFFNQLRTIPLDTELYNFKEGNGIQVQSMTKFLGESPGSEEKKNASSSIIDTTQTFVPLVINNETNFDFKVVDNSLEDSADSNKEEAIKDDMIKITQAKLQRFQWIYEIEDKIDYLQGIIASLLPDQIHKQSFNDLVSNQQVTEEVFQQDPYKDPLLKKSYYNLVYYRSHLDKVKQEIFINS